MLRRLRHLRGTADRQRGAAAVEAALVTPLILLIFFATLEFGMLFKDWLSVISSVRAGVRIASAEPRTVSFAQDAAKQVANGAAALDMSGVKALWVYKADANGYPDGGKDFTSCSTCVQYTWDKTSQKFTQSGVNNWPSTSQSACPGHQDTVGIYLKLQHQALTGFIFQNVTINEHSVMALEPIPKSSGCSP